MTQAFNLIARRSIDKASQVLSKALRAGARIECVEIKEVDISEITESIYQDNRSVIGAITELVGDTNLSFLFVADIKDAFTLTDLFLRKPVGTTKEFSIYVDSTIQEIGNMISSSISNVFSTDFNVSLKPTPPIVVKDYEGSVFSEFVLIDENIGDKLFIIDTRFFIVAHEISCKMYLVPAKGTLESLEFFFGSI